MPPKRKSVKCEKCGSRFIPSSAGQTICPDACTNPMGSPKIHVDWEQFDSLCEIQCTLQEIASFFRCSEDTIEHRVKEKFECTFSELWKKKSAGGRSSLRRKQFQVALKGNVSMLIWLGKQYLYQRDVNYGPPPDKPEKKRKTPSIAELTKKNLALMIDKFENGENLSPQELSSLQKSILMAQESLEQQEIKKPAPIEVKIIDK